MQIELRPLEVGDFELISHYEDEINIKRFLNFTKKVKEDIMFLLNPQNYLWFTIRLDGKIVGDIIAELEENEVAFSVRIDKNYRGHGVFATTLELLEEELRKLKWQFCRMYAGIEKENIICRKACEKIGFVEIGVDEDGIIEYIKEVGQSPTSED
ncbi:MAG: GNAT family N-acetyltransferase [Clostridia bacterium]